MQISSQGKTVWAGGERFITYADFPESKSFDLIWSCAPVDGSHQALPDTLDELRVGQRACVLLRFDSSDNLSTKLIHEMHHAKQLVLTYVFV